MRIASVPINYIKTGLSRALKNGHSADQLLKLANIPKEQVDSNTGRVSIETYAIFSANLAILLDDESCGLMKTAIKLGAFSILCQSGINCKNLGSLLKHFITFFNIISDEVTIRLTVDNGLAYYSLEPLTEKSENSDHIAMIFLAVSHRLSCWAIDKKIAISRVNITRKKSASDKDYYHLFGAPAHFSEKTNEIVFQAALLSEPIVQDKQSLSSFLENPILSLLSSRYSNESLTSKIQAIIKKDIATQFPSFEEVADQLHFTTATLRRHLSTEGVTYKQIKDELRRDCAIYELEQGVSIEQVAENTGFSEPSSFFRSFKRWTGTTPRSYPT